MSSRISGNDNPTFLLNWGKRWNNKASRNQWRIEATQKYGKKQSKNHAVVPSYSSSLCRWLSSIRLSRRRTGEGSRTRSSMWGAVTHTRTHTHLSITHQRVVFILVNVSNIDTYQREYWRMGSAGQFQLSIFVLDQWQACCRHKVTWVNNQSHHDKTSLFSAWFFTF